jgi:hypothetical protein
MIGKYDGQRNQTEEKHADLAPSANDPEDQDHESSGAVGEAPSRKLR